MSLVPLTATDGMPDEDPVNVTLLGQSLLSGPVLPPQLVEWRHLIASGVSRSSQCRRASELRAWLMGNGYWDQCYDPQLLGEV